MQGYNTTQVKTMILEEFIAYYRKNKLGKRQAKEVLLFWLREELQSPPQKNYQKVLHNELELVNNDSVVPKNKQGEALLSSLLRITNIIEEKEFESWASTVKPRDFIHASTQM